MSLEAAFTVRRPQHTTTVDIVAQPGEVIGLIGPNGAGKSTTLRALAGLLPISSGSISLDGEIMADDDRHLPAHRRRIGFVFQEHLLFPHLTALDNVAFGPRSRGAGKAAARRTAYKWLDQMGMSEFADRRPRQLSGGQAQRIAIARALAGDPRLLLLDEPTAALDAHAAMLLRARLRDHLKQFTGASIVVTHTALDAMVIADRLVVLDEGKIVQVGVPAAVAARPRTHHVAALVGLNLMRGTADNGVVTIPGGAEIVAAEQLSGPAFAAFSPAAVSLYTTPPAGSPRNVWAGAITSLAPHGDVVRVQVRGSTSLIADITPGALASLELRPGSPVWASVKATEVEVYPA